MPADNEFSFNAIVEKEKEEKSRAAETPLKDVEDVIGAFENARFHMERIKQLEEYKKELAERNEQLRLLNFRLMDFFREHDLEMKGNTGWENRVTAFFYEMYLKMNPAAGYSTTSRQHLIEETHRWKEAERKSDERAKKAESELASLRRKITVPEKVLHSANLLDGSPIKEHLNIDLVEALNDVTDFIRDLKKEQDLKNG
ncbi:MAG: hypothetical protein E6R04_09365 [Spirochaetes bacterium]|nr:MAG: hypothetical protein E6R04_09365 [Spirochaetota bacterium]